MAMNDKGPFSDTGKYPIDRDSAEWQVVIEELSRGHTSKTICLKRGWPHDRLAKDRTSEGVAMDVARGKALYAYTVQEAMYGIIVKGKNERAIRMETMAENPERYAPIARKATQDHEINVKDAFDGMFETYHRAVAARAAKGE